MGCCISCHEVGVVFRELICLTVLVAFLFWITYVMCHVYSRVARCVCVCVCACMHVPVQVCVCACVSWGRQESNIFQSCMHVYECAPVSVPLVLHLFPCLSSADMYSCVPHVLDTVRGSLAVIMPRKH